MLADASGRAFLEARQSPKLQPPAQAEQEPAEAPEPQKAGPGPARAQQAIKVDLSTRDGGSETGLFGDSGGGEGPGGRRGAGRTAGGWGDGWVVGVWGDSYASPDK